jgi:hypothetical protein
MQRKCDIRQVVCQFCTASNMLLEVFIDEIVYTNFSVFSYKGIMSWCTATITTFP